MSEIIETNPAEELGKLRRLSVGKLEDIVKCMDGNKVVWYEQYQWYEDERDRRNSGWTKFQNGRNIHELKVVVDKKNETLGVFKWSEVGNTEGGMKVTNKDGVGGVLNNGETIVSFCLVQLNDVGDKVMLSRFTSLK